MTRIKYPDPTTIFDRRELKFWKTIATTIVNNSWGDGDDLANAEEFLDFCSYARANEPYPYASSFNFTNENEDAYDYHIEDYG